MSGQPERPHSIQVQASTLTLSNVNPDRHGLKTALESHGDALRFYPQQQADVPVQWEDFQVSQRLAGAQVDPDTLPISLAIALPPAAAT